MERYERSSWSETTWTDVVHESAHDAVRSLAALGVAAALLVLLGLFF